MAPTTTPTEPPLHDPVYVAACSELCIQIIICLRYKDEFKHVFEVEEGENSQWQLLQKPKDLGSSLSAEVDFGDGPTNLAPQTHDTLQEISRRLCSDRTLTEIKDAQSWLKHPVKNALQILWNEGEIDKAKLQEHMLWYIGILGI